MGIGPDACQAYYPLRGDTEVGAGAHQDIFQAAYEFNYAQRFAFAVGAGESAQIKDGIADDLAGAVEGYVAAAVAFEEFDPTLLQEFRRGEYVRGFGIAAQGDYRFVLQQEKDVADFFFFAEGDQLLLQFQAGGVIDSAELDNGDHVPVTQRAAFP